MVPALQASVLYHPPNRPYAAVILSVLSLPIREADWKHNPLHGPFSVVIALGKVRWVFDIVSKRRQDSKGRSRKVRRVSIGQQEPSPYPRAQTQKAHLACNLTAVFGTDIST